MVWLVLMVLGFNYVFSLLLTEGIWADCPNENTPLLCDRFRDVLSTMMTLYQIQYMGLTRMAMAPLVGPSFSLPCRTSGCMLSWDRWTWTCPTP